MKRIISLILSFIIGFSVLYVVPTNVEASDNPITVRLNGVSLKFNDTKPQIINGRTMVPMRTIFEAMGATVTFDGSTQTITANRNDITITMQINSTKLYRNNTEINIDTSPIIIGSSTLVPIRVIAECLNSDLIWDNFGSPTVIIFDYENINTNTNVGCYEKYTDIPDIGYYLYNDFISADDQVITNGVSTCYTYYNYEYGDDVVSAYRKVLQKFGFDTAGTPIKIGDKSFNLYLNGDGISHIYVPISIKGDGIFRIYVDYLDSIPYAG